MSIEKINPRVLVLITFIVVTGVIRTVLSADANMYGLGNFSPLGAMALFGGVYFHRIWKALFFPLLSLFVSDVVLQFTVFYKPGNGILYGSWYYVYGAFVLMVLIGRFVKRVSIGNLFIASLAVVIVHWIITDIPVWYNSKIFPQTIAGYWQCLLVAIPFEWRFLTGTIVYSGVLFGLFEWMQKKYTVLSGSK